MQGAFLLGLLATLGFEPVFAQDQKACTDSNNGATDMYGDGCTWYDSNRGGCGDYDDSDFTAHIMCCSCSGGSQTTTIAFDGFCRYGNNQKDPFRDFVAAGVDACREACRSERDCTAYAWDNSLTYCNLYQGR